jgi:hypothetical protein
LKTITFTPDLGSILLVKDAPAETAGGDHKLKIIREDADAGDLLSNRAVAKGIHPCRQAH